MPLRYRVVVPYRDPLFRQAVGLLELSFRHYVLVSIHAYVSSFSYLLWSLEWSLVIHCGCRLGCQYQKKATLHMESDLCKCA